MIQVQSPQDLTSQAQKFWALPAGDGEPQRVLNRGLRRSEDRIIQEPVLGTGTKNEDHKEASQ